MLQGERCCGARLYTRPRAQPRSRSRSYRPGAATIPPTALSAAAAPHVKATGLPVPPHPPWTPSPTTPPNSLTKGRYTSDRASSTHWPTSRSPPGVHPPRRPLPHRDTTPPTAPSPRPLLRHVRRRNPTYAHGTTSPTSSRRDEWPSRCCSRCEVISWIPLRSTFGPEDNVRGPEKDITSFVRSTQQLAYA